MPDISVYLHVRLQLVLAHEHSHLGQILVRIGCLITHLHPESTKLSSRKSHSAGRLPGVLYMSCATPRLQDQPTSETPSAWLSAAHACCKVGPVVGFKHVTFLDLSHCTHAGCITHTRLQSTCAQVVHVSELTRGSESLTMSFICSSKSACSITIHCTCDTYSAYCMQTFPALANMAGHLRPST